MKKYKLDLLEEKKSIGVLEVDKDSEKIRFVLTKEMETKYLGALSRLIDRLNREGNFEIVWNKDKRTIQKLNKDFWLAFKQELIRTMNIILLAETTNR